MTAENGYMTYIPTRRERLWRSLGYRYHLGAEPGDVDALTGWMCTESKMHFGIADRLRLLLTGKLRISIKHHMPVQPDFSKNRFDWEIVAPGERT